jgi:hypothetical protein
MKVTNWRDGAYVVTSYGNGWACAVDGPLGSLFLQDEEAAAFREERDAFEGSMEEFIDQFEYAGRFSGLAED